MECVHYPEGNLDDIIVNNLDGSKEGEEVITYSNFIDSEEGTPLNLIVNVKSTSEYDPANANQNGNIEDGEFGQININTDSSVTLEFTLVDPNTGAPVEIPGIYVSVYDLGMNHDFFLFFFVFL